jgi:hypothetical protein
MADNTVAVPVASATEYEQLYVMLDSLRIFHEREQVRFGLWEKFDLGDALHNCRSKVERAMMAAEHLQHAQDDIEEENPLVKEIEDSLLDLVNFAVFGVRHLRAGRIRG